MGEEFETFLEQLEAEYPKHRSSNFISSNYGRPMRIELKSGEIFGVVWFRWEDQNDQNLQNKIIRFNSGKREIDKFNLNFVDIKNVDWN
ncbi:MAG: hypothetical protein Q8927_17790 [Bacteroidota bacterium]|nr:hypothetical protein [Bacteroidota bacterium]MDP4218059.1 hypothetical protein [Bacteroidota bacterium]MDP4257633.1 hypothetical protein [Bacteroidota bacterium]